MGGGPTFGKNSQIMSFFFLTAYLIGGWLTLDSNDVADDVKAAGV